MFTPQIPSFPKKIRIMKKGILCIAIVLFSLLSTQANNIQVANVLLNGQNTISHYSLVNFDVSWENSWRTITNESNYDGAWVFIKFRKKSSSLWQHATINGTGNTAPAGSVIQTAADGKGMWIYHTLPGADFTGNVNYTGAKLQWNYGVDGVLDTDSVEVRLFALEMVYVPAGAFKVGSGGTETNHFVDGTSSNPYNVGSEAAITVGTTAGNLNYANNNGIAGDQSGPIPAGFPKGFNAFWLMKYESSQQQYADFLNNLDLTRATNRNTGIFTGTHPSLVAPFPERAMNGLSMDDVTAFADWAGMRPFTELEYEKACRGYNQTPVPNEYPWGNTTITAVGSITNAGLVNEAAGAGNANYGNALGRTTRTGIFATASSDRTASGGTYYGIMDMGGNVWELGISVGSPNGRLFTNVNGDGNLDASGNNNVATWPTLNVGYCGRGGYYADAIGQLRISDRSNGTFNSSGRLTYIGMRLARTAE
jgi:formylglycine-generating enzyme required for sulfatase activity